MKEYEKLADDFVINEIKASYKDVPTINYYLNMAFKKGFLKCREMAADLVEAEFFRVELLGEEIMKLGEKEG
jgi:hypothetical protein